jgi:hypothetical protein
VYYQYWAVVAARMGKRWRESEDASAFQLRYEDDDPDRVVADIRIDEPAIGRPAPAVILECTALPPGSGTIRVRFDDVRIHDDERADVLNRAFHANALTYGNDIYFGRGAYRPETASGAGLLAHELRHVMQQRESGSARVQRQALPAASGQPAEYVLMEPYTVAGMELPARTTVYEVPGGGQASMISVTLPPPWRNAGEVFSVPQQILRPVGVPRSGAGQQSATQLTNTQRGALLTQLSHRLGAASEDFRQAANQVVDDLRAEAAEKAELISLLVSVATVFVVPRLSASITRLINSVPASASVTTHRAALALMNEADNIAGAIGEVVKETSKREISSIVQRQSGDFFEQLHEGYQAYTDNILGYVSRNIENREVLPDAKLWLYVANWDVRAISPSLFKPRIRNVWNRYESQVLAIKDTVVYDMITGGGGTRTFAAEVRLRNGERRMALLRTRSAAGLTGAMEWVRWIDEQFEEAARARNEAQGFNRNIVVDASEVEDLP